MDAIDFMSVDCGRDPSSECAFRTRAGDREPSRGQDHGRYAPHSRHARQPPRIGACFSHLVLEAVFFLTIASLKHCVLHLCVLKVLRSGLSRGQDHGRYTPHSRRSRQPPRIGAFSTTASTKRCVLNHRGLEAARSKPHMIFWINPYHRIVTVRPNPGTSIFLFKSWQGKLLHRSRPATRGWKRKHFKCGVVKFSTSHGQAWSRT
jgi:hypothetical protein